MSAVSSAAIPRSISFLACSKVIFDIIVCDQLWCAMVWPSAAIRRTSSGDFAEDLPTRRTWPVRIPWRAPPVPLRARRPRPVVKGEDDLMVSQRERFPKAVQSNARVGLCVDLEDAGGASTSCRGQSAASVTTIPASSRVTAPASGVVNLSRRVFECATPPPLPEPAALPKHHNLMRFRWLLGKGSLAAGELIYCAIVRTPGPIQRHFARIEGRPSLQRLSAPGGQSSGTLHIT